jgi:pimeloyl-ACP methyl ester carboxylesterase
MPYANINDIRMYYEEQGQGEPLLLLHGAFGAVDPAVTSGWSALLPALAARYRTFSLEHRGHGRTDNPAGRLSYAQLARDVAAFIERFELAPAHVAGFSDGATIGLALGMTRPELLRSLVCVGPNYRIDDQLRQGMEFFDAAALERESPDFAAELARRHDAHHYPGYWRELVGQVRANVEAELAWTEDDLRRIPVPTLLIMGEADFVVSLEQMLEMRRNIPSSEMLILNHAGMDGLANHRVQFTRADVVGPVILEFLERHAGTAAPKAGAIADFHHEDTAVATV